MKFFSKSILIFFISILFFACKSNSKTDENAIQSDDKMITLSAKSDGLHITKKHDAKFVNVTIHVESENGENFSIDTNNTQNKFVYPFVQSGKNYSVYLVMMDKNWGNYTVSKKATIKAEGGLGDCSIKYSTVDYDTDLMSLCFTDFEFILPSSVDFLTPTYESLIYYDVKNGINWSKNYWASNPIKEQNNLKMIDISSSAKVLLNNDFAIQLTCKFIYKNVVYQKRIVDESKIFSDIHPITNIWVDNGTLLPNFSPKFTNYTITGTDKDSQIHFEYLDGTIVDLNNITLNKQNNFAQITATYKDKNMIYKFKYDDAEKITFDGEKYVQTFFDDFSGDDLDLSKWKRSPQQERQPNMKNHGWWKDECSYLEDGKLVIEAKRDGDLLISGAIDTKGIFEQSHGLYEIKFKCQKTSGLWYAFWLMGENDEAHIGNGATNAAEIDVWELVPNEPNDGPNFFKSTIHWDAYGAEHKSAGTETYNPSDAFYDEWHVAQFVWGKESYKLFLDGKLMWEMPGEKFGGMCEGKNHLIISSEFGEWGGKIDDNLLPAKMYVDYVKVYTEET